MKDSGLIVLVCVISFALGYMIAKATTKTKTQPVNPLTNQIDTIRIKQKEVQNRIDSAQINAAYRTKLLKDLRNENDSTFADYFANPDSFIIVPIAKFRQHDTGMANGAGGM